MLERLWIDDPSILFTKDTWYKFVPLSYMDVPTSMNALVRFVTYSAILLSAMRSPVYLLMIPLVLVLTVVLTKLFPNTKEMFTEVLKKVQKFTLPTGKNPFMNPLLTEILDNPNRPDAAPVTSMEVKKQIRQAFMETSDLHMDTADKFDQAQAMRTFTTLQSAMIPNNQDGFLNFLAKGQDDPDYSSAFPSRNAKIKSEGYVEALGSTKSLPNTTSKPSGVEPSRAKSS